MDHSYYLFTTTFHHLFLGLLAGFLAKRLWRSPRTALISVLAIALGLSALGCFFQSLSGIVGMMAGPEYTIGPRRWIGMLGVWMSPFANVFILTALTVFVFRGVRDREGAPGGILTREERYGTGRVQKHADSV